MTECVMKEKLAARPAAAVAARRSPGAQRRNRPRLPGEPAGVPTAGDRACRGSAQYRLAGPAPTAGPRSVGRDAAGGVLGAVAADWRDRPLYLVVGMLNTKDAAGFLAPLAAHARALWAVTIPGEPNPLPAEKIVAAADTVGLPAREAPSVAAALAAITAAEPGPARVLICGSLHLAGVILAENG